MSEPIIIVENLSKRYFVGHQGAHGEWTTLRDAITREARNFARKTVDALRGREIIQGDAVEEFWALKNISFEIKPGEIVGIIGRNGAGKSTLLKILSRITDPTEGRVELRGRISSLLEVGTGFHPELSGRENIFLNGAILGMTRQEVRKKFDEIVAFAEVERFLDTPVKRYSSGMYVRLAFAVAAHLEPEILVIDEVLAVGDADFQKKCIGKMDEISRGQGRTIICVSHNLALLSNLCPTAIWLENGALSGYGPTEEIISTYTAIKQLTDYPIARIDKTPRASFANTERVQIESLEWLTGLPLRHGQAVTARIFFQVKNRVSALSFAIGFCHIDGSRILTYNTDIGNCSIRTDIENPGFYSVDLIIDQLPLQPDLYDVVVASRSGDFQVLDYVPGAIRVEILAGPTTPTSITQKFAGVRLSSTSTWNLNPLDIDGQK